MATVAALIQASATVQGSITNSIKMRELEDTFSEWQGDIERTWQAGYELGLCTGRTLPWAVQSGLSAHVCMNRYTWL
jgi:hypothetical protein